MGLWSNGPTRQSPVCSRLRDGFVSSHMAKKSANSIHNYGLLGRDQGEAAFEDRHASMAAYIDYLRPRCVELALLRSVPRRGFFPCQFSNPSDDEFLRVYGRFR